MSVPYRNTNVTALQIPSRFRARQIYDIANCRPSLNESRPFGPLRQMRLRVKPAQHFPVPMLCNAPLRYIDICISEIVTKM